jgi:choline-sulfatase
VLLVVPVCAVTLAVACGKPAKPRNAVLVLVDTLRADRLSAYGYPTRTSPSFDALAEQGVLFETTVSNGSWTLPGMAGIFSGDFPNKRIFDGSLQQSLIGRFREAGLRTAAFVEGGFMSESFGFDRGFDEFHNASSENFLKGDEHEVVLTEKTFAAAEAWLRENAENPFFLVVHTYETHTPYTRLDYAEGLDSGALGRTFGVLDAGRIQAGALPFGATERRYVGALYDGGVLTADRALGGLLRTLDELGIRNETVVVVTSDHGEDIGGRDPEWPGVHGHHLYDELLLVPLVVQDPTRRFPVSRVSQQVRTIDVLHTILDLLGVAAGTGSHGRSLVPLMTGDEQDDRYAWSRSTEMSFFQFPERYALRAGRHKLILTRGEGNRLEPELYDLGADPGERENRAGAQPKRARRMQAQLMRLREEIDVPAPAHYTIRAPRDVDGLEERLEALGYLE